MPGPVFLETETVSLRPAEEADIPFLRENAQNPEIRASRGMRSPVDSDWARQRLGGTMGRTDDTIGLLVCRDETPVGFAYLIREQPNDAVYRSGELAYWITPDEWGNGYATAAGRLLLEQAFDALGLHRVEATAFSSNDASRRVLEKLGFTEEGVARGKALVEGAWTDVVRYGLLEAEWVDSMEGA